MKPATRLTARRLRAMECALTAMLAGCEGEGDWPEGVSRPDMEAAESWVAEQVQKRQSPRLKP